MPVKKRKKVGLITTVIRYGNTSRTVTPGILTARVTTVSRMSSGE